MIDSDGFRPNVGIILTNEREQVLWARRVGQNSWQFPQGGIKQHEAPKDALYRELYEELGLSEQCVEVVGCTQRWLRYTLPHRYIRKNCSPVCIATHGVLGCVAAAARGHGGGVHCGGCRLAGLSAVGQAMPKPSTCQGAGLPQRAGESLRECQRKQAACSHTLMAAASSLVPRRTEKTDGRSTAAISTCDASRTASHASPIAATAPASKAAAMSARCAPAPLCALGGGLSACARSPLPIVGPMGGPKEQPFLLTNGAAHPGD